MSSRQFRHAVSTTGLPFDASTQSNFAKVIPGTYGPITVQENGDIVISREAYADDVLAFVLGCISSNPTIDPLTKQNLGVVIDMFDARAVFRHGYSGSEEEKNFEWTPVANKYATS
jgi:hypothetical protein